MDVLEAIHTRRTTKEFLPAPVPRELIERVLEAAVWAPNHHLTEPWEFIVVQGEALQQLARLRQRMTAEFAATTDGGSGTPDLDGRPALDAYRKALAAPVSIVVTMALHPDPAIREEDYAATAAAIQNMMLAAHGLGMAAFWSTNAIVSYPPARELLGVAPDRRIVGVVQLGYPAQRRTGKRAPASSRTRWLGAPRTAEADEADEAQASSGGRR